MKSYYLQGSPTVCSGSVVGAIWILVLNLAFCAYSCPILMKLKFSRKISEKHANIEFHENTSSGSRALPNGQTDGHDEAKSRF
jgi:hypothetical protein